jgi:hypothetical protein
VVWLTVIFIDKNGTLQYMGGIDSLATADVADIARAEPYRKEAMLAVVHGQPRGARRDQTVRLFGQILGAHLKYSTWPQRAGACR